MRSRTRSTEVDLCPTCGKPKRGNPVCSNPFHLSIDAKVLMLEQRFNEMLARIAELERERDEAIQWIRVVSEEFVNAGYSAGDRAVTLAHIRELLSGRNTSQEPEFEEIEPDLPPGEGLTNTRAAALVRRLGVWCRRCNAGWHYKVTDTATVFTRCECNPAGPTITLTAGQYDAP